MKPTFFRRARFLTSSFFLKPASPRPLAALRITVAAVLLVQAMWLAPEFFEFFGTRGILQESLQRFLAEPGTPRLAALLEHTAHWGISERTVLSLTGGAYVLALLGLLTGFLTRVSALTSWFLHWTLMSTGACTVYGVDVFAHIFLFYLVFVPAGRAWSLDSVRTEPGRRSWDARLGLRVMQLHLCAVYLSSGIEKAVGPQWQTGEVMWRSLMLPMYQRFDFSWLAEAPWLALLLAWGALAIELGYVVFIWPRATRHLWVALTMALHLGIVVFLGLELFGFIMTAFTWALFGISAETRRAARLPSPAKLEPLAAEKLSWA